MKFPQFGELLVCKDANAITGPSFPQTLERRHAHHRVAKPVHTADDDFRRLLRMRARVHGLRAGSSVRGAAAAFGGASFQRLCTQNQFAGSRRTASSNALLTSSIMAAVDRASPFSLVGISGPASRRHLPS